MNNKILILCGFCTVWCVGFLPSTRAQYGARNTVPETVQSCYRNSTAYNRYTRQPMHINNLIAIVRKIERKEPQLDMRRIARILVNRYMFDGLEFTSNARPELQYNPNSQESIKTAMIKSWIPLQGEEVIPQGVLDNDELCSLHWMLSHSMNATVRDEELGINPYNFNNPTNNNGYNTNNNNNQGYNNNANNQYSGQRGRRSADNDDETSSEYGDKENEEDKISQEEDPEQSDPSVKVQQESSVSTEQDSDLPQQGPDVQGKSAVNAKDDDDDDADVKKLSRQVSVIDPTKSRRPIETGVVYTNWGSISAGRLISGIAAALEPMNIPVGGSGSPYPNPGFGTNSGSGYNGFGSGGSNTPFGSGTNNNNNNPFNTGSGSNPNYPPNNPQQQQYGRKRRQAYNPITFQPLQSIHAATLAGDIGQSAMRNGKWPITQVPLPRGIWNDTICPREYILEQYPYNDKEIYMEDAALTYVTEAEVRGGMDGLILGSNIQRWNNAGFRLSEVLDMYYSEIGISGEPQFRSCNRGSLFSGSVDPGAIQEQSKSFAYLYNNYTQSIPAQTINDNPNVFLSPVSDVYNKVSGVVASIGGGDPQCKRTQSTASSTLDTDDNLKYTETKNRIYAVLDHTATFDEILAQKRFIGQLAHEINVSPRGSRLGVVDGSSGQILISPNLTDVGAILACNVLALPTQIKTMDLIRVFTNLKTEFQKLRDEEVRMNYESDLGIVVLVMVQGKKLEEGQKSGISQLLNEINNNFGDVKMLFTSSKYQQGDFDGFLLDPAREFIRIQSTQNISDFADEFATEMKTKVSHGRLSYLKCNTNMHNQDEEHKVATTFFVTPDTIQYYKVSPDYFYSAKNLRIRFTTDNGKVRICQSRDEQFPNTRNVGGCKETSGTYVTPGNSQVDVEFDFSKPCGKHGNRNGCKPIYFSFTPTQYPVGGQTGLDCSIEGCQFPNQVKVTFTHWDMRCNGAFRNLISLPMALATLIISFFFSNKTT